jgi:hypothetical protein
MTRFIFDTAEYAAARETLDAQPPPPEDILEIARHRAAEYDQKMKDDITGLAAAADEVDARADSIVQLMRKDFDKIRF